MDRFRKKIIILGKGEFGNYLFNFAKEKLFLNIECISIRKSNFFFICEKLVSCDVIIDCMDRNIIDKDKKRLEFVEKIRNKISFKKDIFYIYISSSNIYSKSSFEIDEDSKLTNQKEFSYEKNKLEVEDFLTRKFPLQNLLITRLPSVWHFEMKNGSFMGDLVNSYKSKKVLNPRLGDDDIISFIHIKNAAEILFNLYLNDYYGIKNITTQEWASRKDLKLKLKNNYKNSYGKKIITNNYDYENFIEKKVCLL